MEIVPLPWCPRDYSHAERNWNYIPDSNPVIKDRYNWHENYKGFLSILGWGYNQGSSSSEGYHHYNASSVIDTIQVVQSITLSTSFILDNHNIVGYQWGLSIQQHLKYISSNQPNSINNKFIIDSKELQDHFKQTINISRMKHSSDPGDIKLANGILSNYLNQPEIQ